MAGHSDGEIVASARVPTTAPDDTMARAVERLKAFQTEHGRLEALGIAAFGPIDLRPSSPAYGCLLNTPKPQWSHARILDRVDREFSVPVALASDVEGAALAEGLLGAAKDADPFVYLTVGTGIGAGVIAGGRPVRGLLHPEIGHIGVARRPGDRFPGSCPFHGDCLEGMASGPAMSRRWGMPAEDLTGDLRTEALTLEAGYLADGLRSIVFSFAPRRIVVGGGVGLTPGLLPMVREALKASLGGYPGIDEFTEPGYVRAAELGGMAGAAGALVLAGSASTAHSSRRTNPPGGEEGER